MDSSRQQGKADLSTLIFFIVLALVGWATWKVGPVYFDHYTFLDKVNEICGTPAYKVKDPERIPEALLKAVRAADLTTWIDRKNFVITATDSRRRIELSYEREVEILPGWTHTFKFESVSEQPLI